MGNNNNDKVSLKRVWLVLIIVTCIGSPFLAFGMFQGEVKANTKATTTNTSDIKTIEALVYNPDYGIAALNAKLDILIRLNEKIELNTRNKGE